MFIFLSSIYVYHLHPSHVFVLIFIVMVYACFLACSDYAVLALISFLPYAPITVEPICFERTFKIINIYHHFRGQHRIHRSAAARCRISPSGDVPQKLAMCHKPARCHKPAITIINSDALCIPHLSSDFISSAPPLSSQSISDVEYLRRVCDCIREKHRRSS